MTQRSESLISLHTRFQIVGVEVVAVGVFLLVTFALDQSGTGLGRLIPSIDSDLPIVGAALVLIGLEIFSLIKQLPRPTSTESETAS